MNWKTFTSLFIFVFVVSDSVLFSEDNGRYTGPISRSEKRILDGKTEFQKTGTFPLEWKLFFKGKQGDFVVFYDLNGDEIHYRYRRNKFDLDAEFFVKDLFPGNPYRVNSVDERGKRSSLPTPKKIPADPKEFSDRQSVPIFKLIEYIEVRTDDLLY